MSLLPIAPPAGLEPALFGLEVRARVHQAKGPSDSARPMNRRSVCVCDLWGLYCTPPPPPPPSPITLLGLCVSCAGAMLIFSVSSQFQLMIPEGNPKRRINRGHDLTYFVFLDGTQGGEWCRPHNVYIFSHTAARSFLNVPAPPKALNIGNMQLCFPEFAPRKTSTA